VVVTYQAVLAWALRAVANNPHSRGAKADRCRN
jgi:hypothetical protein